MKTLFRTVLLTVAGLSLPLLSNAQVADGINSLHSVLDQLYEEMITLCSQLISVGQGIAGFAASWYIASRVWRHIANAEPIDFYPLFRPFVLGFCIMIFPSVLDMINGVMKPTVTATAEIVEGSHDAIETLLQKKWEILLQSDAWRMYVGETGFGDRDLWYKYTHPGESPSSEGVLESIGNDLKFAMDKVSFRMGMVIKQWMSGILEVLFQAAALCIDTLRTFQLVVLGILGPLIFGLSVFDGFQHTLTMWLARYINVFLWLPVANIFGSIIAKIQELMLQADIAQLQDYGDTFFSATDIAYLVFMIIGIVGYFTVPSVANYIVHAGGSALTHRATNIFGSSASTTVNATSNTLGAIGQEASELFDRKFGGNHYMDDKLRGNP